MVSFFPFTSARPAIERVVVVIPAHNEARLLPSCLGAVERACDQVSVPVDVTVVLDACTDESRHTAESRVDTLFTSAGAVGAARRAGFASHLDNFDHNKFQTTWLATTDADSEVPAHWIERQLSLAADGADGYAGTVSPKNWAGWSDDVAHRYWQRYQPRDGHRHVHGANLGFRADCYRKVGGFAPLDHDEDVDLVRRLTAAGARIDYCARAPVLTSTRSDGRTGAGYAGYLTSIQSELDPQVSS